MHPSKIALWAVFCYIQIMKRSWTIFLQIVIVAIGISALTFLLWEPHLEGRNANATLFEIYFKDPFLACAYLASMFFFAALFQAFKLVEYIRTNALFSQRSVKALRVIKYCAVILIAFIVVGEAYLFIVMKGKDDIAGGVAMGVFIAFISIVIATAAAISEKTLHRLIQPNDAK